jgi:DNA-binding transcriptional LysR family regulator
MSVDIRSMRLFVAVLEMGNFSQVARRENMSPSSVSRIIQQLESELGAQLLYRNTRAIVATEVGRQYGQTFRAMLSELDETTRRVHEREGSPGGLVRINAPVVFGQKHIAPWLGELWHAWPDLKVELVQTDEFIDPLADAADLLFRIGPLADSGAHARIVDRSELLLAASPGYLARHGIPETPRSLMNHNCLVYKGAMGLQRTFFSRPGAAPQVMTLSGSLTSNNAETLVNAALSDAGIIMMPDWQVGELLRTRQLALLLPDYTVSTHQEPPLIAMLYPHTRYLSLSVRTVIDFFIDRFGSPPRWKLPGDKREWCWQPDQKT